jgi:PST family polysaccharide transporter
MAARTRKGTLAILAARLLSLAVSAVSITILSRLIAPSDFGVWAVAVVALAVMTLVREMGLVAALVQAPRLTAEQQTSYFFTSIAASLGAAAMLAVAAPGLAALYRAPLIAPVLWACCASLVIAGFGLVPAALLRRELRYDKVAVIEGGGMLCALVASLAVAYRRGDVWALVAGHIASATWMAGAALILSRWRPGPPRRASKIDLSFSLQIMAYNVLGYAGNNVGVAAGYRFPSAELGFFNRAQQLYNLAHFAVLTPITEVGYSQLCRLQSQAYRDAYVSLARRVYVLFVPYAATLPFVADDLVRVLLGAVWGPASPVLAWFAPAVLAQAFAALFGLLMTSQGRGRELRRWALGELLVRGAGALAGSAFGIAGVAAGFSLAALLVAVPVMAWIAGRSGPVRLRDQLGALWPALLLGAAAAAGAVLGGSLASATPLSRLLYAGGGAALAWAVL